MIRTNSLHRATASVALIAVLAACESASRSHARSTVRPPGLELTSDPEVEAQLELIGPRIVRRANGEFLELSLRSKASERQDVQVWIEWYDRRGARIETALDGWTPVTLDRGALRELSIPVPVAGVGSWRLHAARIDGPC